MHQQVQYCFELVYKPEHGNSVVLTTVHICWIMCILYNPACQLPLSSTISCMCTARNVVNRYSILSSRTTWYTTFKCRWRRWNHHHHRTQGSSYTWCHGESVRMCMFNIPRTCSSSSLIVVIAQSIADRHASRRNGPANPNKSKQDGHAAAAAGSGAWAPELCGRTWGATITKTTASYMNNGFLMQFYVKGIMHPVIYQSGVDFKVMSMALELIGWNVFFRY